MQAGKGKKYQSFELKTKKTNILFLWNTYGFMQLAVPYWLV
jgi:hypothetical protein